MAALHLHTTLEPYGPAAAVMLTGEQVASLGGGKSPAVRVTIGGTTVEGRIGRMGDDILLGFSKAKRAELGVETGDVVDVVIELDDQPRVYEAPPALAEALASSPTAQAAWDVLAPSKRKEYARQVTEAKAEATRDRRIAKAIAELEG